MELDKYLNKISHCRICIEQPGGAPLPHEPRPVLRASASARICIAGQAPGTRVHASGKPFDDPSGKRLRDWMGVSEDEFYDRNQIAIIPMGFCFPGLDTKGGDLPPRRECARAWRNELFEQLENIQLLLLVGQYAQNWHLGPERHKTLTQTVFHWQDYIAPESGIPCFPVPHPSWRNNAWINRNPWFKTDLLPVLQQQIRTILTHKN